MVNEKLNVLYVDDEREMCSLAADLISTRGYLVDTATDGLNALSKVRKKPADIVLTDLRMPRMNGMELLTRVKESYPLTEVIMISGYGSIPLAVEASKKGAFGFVTKPFALELIDELDKAKNFIIKNRGKAGLNKQLRLFRTADFIFESAKMKDLDGKISDIALSNASVLITGESGTGKEIIASQIHFRSKRREHPFIRVNCAAIPCSIMESELFGHEKGAFTGAISNRKGRFELADRGTIFLDEIGDMPLSTQVKVLRVLQEREFERVGGTKTIKTDFRVVSATSKNLEEEIQKGLFRKELYYRINVIPIHLFPLKERKTDIPLLANHFVEKFNLDMDKEDIELTDKAMEKLIHYSWPGNIRELENMIERMVVLSSSNIIDEKDIAIDLEGKHFEGNSFFDLPFKEAKKEMLREYLIRFLEKNSWNITKTAAEIGLNRINLIRNMNRLEIKERRRNFR